MAAPYPPFPADLRSLPQRNRSDYQIGKPSFSRKSVRKAVWRCRSSRSRGESGILKLAVSGATEFLRFFSGESSAEIADEGPEESFLIRSVNDVISIIESDYQKAYFLTATVILRNLKFCNIGSTGDFTSTIYDEDCLFEDPTIKFRGRDLYGRNLKLLVPFFGQPSLVLKEIMEFSGGETKSIKASWKLRTYLNFPWKPLISIEGTTLYDLNQELKIIRHAETWNVSPIEAISQIFRPSNLRRMS